MPHGSKDSIHPTSVTGIMIRGITVPGMIHSIMIRGTTIPGTVHGDPDSV